MGWQVATTDKEEKISWYAGKTKRMLAGKLVLKQNLVIYCRLEPLAEVGGAVHPIKNDRPENQI
jgi:hypothetical protein